MQKPLFRKILSNRLFQHSLFWLLSFYVLLRIFGFSPEITKADVIYTFLFHVCLLAAVYPNLLFLIPRLLGNKQYLRYFFVSALLVAVAVLLNFFTFDYLSDRLFPGYYFISYYEVADIFQFVLVYFVLTTLLKLSKSWFQLIENQQEIIRLEKEKLDAELNALKTQINPHFLFNSLNNLYSLALDKDEKTAEVILRLSQNMRYMLYESNSDLVPLEKEIEYLKNYVELQKLRTNKQASISFKIQGKPEKKQLAPLIFISFLENGFKHGIKGDTKDAFIQIELQIFDNELIFKVVNNKGEVDTVEKGQYKGIGLSNVKRRLELLYPEKHELKIINGVREFAIELKLNLT